MNNATISNTSSVRPTLTALKNITNDSLCAVKIHSTKVVKGTDPSPNYPPESGWQAITLPDQWQTRWPDYNGTVWYLIEILEPACNDVKRQPFTLQVDYINMAGAVYLNGEMIWRDEHLKEPLSRSWNMPRYWVLPASSLQNGINQVWVKVIGVGPQGAGLGKFQFGEPAAMLTKHKKTVWDRRTIFLINIISSLTLGCISFSVWLFRTKETEYGWFALSCGFWILFVFNVLDTTTYPFSDTYQLAKVNMLFFLGYIYSFCIYTWRFAHRRHYRTEKAFLIAVIISALLIIIIDTPNIQPTLTAVFILFIVILFINSIFFQYIAYKTRELEHKFLAFCLIAWIVAAFLDVQLTTGRSITSEAVSPYTSLLTTLFIIIILSLRLNKNILKIEQFNHQLKQTVNEVKNELSDSLNAKHQLEIDNMRLQERLQLSHDLHDGLGGSLVRALILVDQNKKEVSKPQFMSILRLLRNDLRQVIDSGSSIGAKVPDIPLTWGAPLRHRFIQIFEEMDIQSTWSFPESWTLKPSAIQCLTLARVVEEALTNVIKHSKATHVSVTMQQKPNHFIELKIADNGVGFDANNLSQTGLSVGIQSMQIRVSRMGGRLNIKSEPGETSMLVILPIKAGKESIIES